ncbi:MAG: SBBP repeat-containing protein, partial [Saprospiraceae bacterium]|nr:SBBP repeat-containing protein [Saprospiraceae bacterium]
MKIPIAFLSYLPLLLCLFISQLSFAQPSLDWATYKGGPNDDSARDMVLDAQGNVYVVGSTNSTAAISSAGAHQAANAGGFDVLLSKFDNNGQLLWSTYFGVAGDEFGQGIALDGLGNLYITGATNSATGFATAGVHQTSFGGGNLDGFVAKFTTNGQLLWATYVGGAEEDFLNAIAVNNAGDIGVTGWTGSPDGIYSGPGGGEGDALQGLFDALIQKFTPNGTRAWGRYLGGGIGDTGADRGLQIVADAVGDFYISGWTGSPSFASGTGVHQSAYGGGTADAFLGYFSAINGNNHWITLYGGAAEEYGDALALDAAGNIYVAGPCISANALATPGSHQPTPGGAFDAFLVKFNDLGQRQWGTYYGGNDDEAGYGLSVGQDGGVYLCGYTRSNNGIAIQNSYQPLNNGGWDAFFAKFDGNGIQEIGTYFGGPADDQSFAIGTDAQGAIFLSGWAGSAADIATAGAHQPSFGGAAQDAFVAKFLPCTPPTVNIPNGGYLCQDNDFVLEMHLTEGSTPYTFIYSSDGVPQPPITVSSTPHFQFFDADFYQDSVQLLTVESNGCLGEFTGLPYLHIVPPVTNEPPVVTCNQTDQTYTVNVVLGGGFFNYIPVPSSAGFINDSLFTSLPIPFGTDYAFQFTAGLNCDTVAVSGTSGCTVDCTITNFSAGTNSPICVGQSIFFNSYGGETYQWSGPNGFSSNIANPTILGATLANTGIYSLDITDANGCTANTAISVIINQAPLVSISSDTFCQGTPVSLL